MKIIKMTSLDLKGKRVLIREDLNVPIKDGEVASDARIRAALPTIQAALTAKARVMLMSHLGRPQEGKFAEEFSLAPVAKRLTQLLGVPAPLKRDWLDGVDRGAGRGGAARERALQQGREERRRGAVAQNGGALRHLRDGRLRHRASRGGEHPWRGEVRADRLRRTVAGERAHGARDGAREARPAAARDRRRLEGVDQAHRARDAALEGRSDDRRRRHRQHLSRGAGLQRRQVAARARDARHLPAPDGAVAKARHRHSDADRRRGGHRVLGRGRGRRQAGG